MIDICVIGGGAAGLAAAVSAARASDGKASIVVLEKNSEPGRKIRATGNGRCNLGNTNCDDFDRVRDFFMSIGVVTRVTEGGRAYPYSEEAASVADALIGAAKSYGVSFTCSAEVTGLEKVGSYFRVTYNKASDKKGAGKNSKTEKTLEARKVILTSGGKAAPQFGTTGDGYRLAKSLGHTVTRLAPALTPVETKEDLRDIAGVRAKGKATLKFDGKILLTEEGEIQFTDYGISGIAIFNLSRLMVIPEGSGLKDGFDRYEISLDLCPDMSPDEVRRLLGKESGGKALLNKDEPDPIYSIVKRKLADKIVNMANGDKDREAELLKEFTLRPSGLKGWKMSEITRGGIPLSEISEDMESKTAPGLYFAGEIMDIDRPCGGYNLESAWITGMRAGEAAAEK